MRLSPLPRAKLRKANAVEDSDVIPDGTARRPHSFDEGRTIPPLLGDSRRPASFELPSRTEQMIPTRTPSFDLSRASSLELTARLGLGLPNPAGLLSINPNSLSPLPPLCSLSGGLSPLHATLASSLSAFSAVDVPKLMVHSPIENRSPTIPSPSQHPLTDGRLLTVPSPDPAARLLSLATEHFRKSPESSRSPVGDLPAEMLASMSNMQTAMLGLNGHLGLGMPGWPTSRVLPQFCTQESGDSMGTDDTTSLSIDLEGLAPHIAQMAAQAQLASPELMAQMPPKSIIQEEVRNGGGRFQLVRKRGRSEVWNLFGQVLDTVTGVRLPYVACYACKVLYTDTGGGTGNMTRHRCPIGTSYRNSLPSTSSETAEGAATSSFDSTLSSTQMHLPKRSCTPERKPHFVTSSQESSCSVTPLISQQSGDVHVGEVERELLAEATARAAALDLRPSAHFTSLGFRQLCERLLLMGRRYGQVPPSDILPDEAMISRSRESLLRFTKDETRNELASPGVEVTICVERLDYQGDWHVVWASRLTNDWTLKHSVLGVYPGSLKEKDAVRQAINSCGLRLDPEHTRTLGLETPMESFENIPDVGMVLEEVVSSTLTLENKSLLMQLADLRQKIAQSGIQLPSKFPNRVTIRGVKNWFEECHSWRLHHEAIQVMLSRIPGLQSEVGAVNWSMVADVEAFLEPFHESLTALSNEHSPTLHMVIPEWSALVHECRVDEEGDRLSSGLRSLKQKASAKLEQAASQLQPVHRMAAVLNPRLARSLAILFTEQQRTDTYRKIRDLCGISPKSEDRLMADTSPSDGEPSRKRRMFLSQLETGDSTDDELECYTRNQFPTQQTREVLTFWATTGLAQFPSLATLAKRLFSVPAVPLSSMMPPTACVSSADLASSLILRRAFENETDD
ncbi:unnamed protein product, partial [Mesorhabditis belari]|uniref:BED-type domain-containing protein n=1 Tax=Mesorhabditis belari TaxID=2138241 RepID=A0AAF3FHC1_9BILA